MNKGYIKISLLLAGLLALVGIGGYLVSASRVSATDIAKICHVPPGNPSNAQTISGEGVRGHLDRSGRPHGLDYIGECGGKNEPEEYKLPYVTYEQECGYVKLTFHNPTPWLFVFDYRVDGEAAVSQSPWAGTPFNDSSPLAPGQFGDRWHLVPVDGNHTQDILLTFDEDSGDHLVEWRLAEGAEQDYYFNWTSTTVKSDCEVGQILVCLDNGEDEPVEKTVPDTKENWDRILFSWPESYKGECEVPEEEPTATPSATPTPRQLTPAGAPICQDLSPATVPTNIHVVRSGSDATVNFFTDSSNANIYYRTSGQSEWQHALRDIPVTDGYVSVTIHDLNPTGDYDFGVESANGCAGSGRVIAVVVDDFSPRTFMFTHYEELN